MNASVKFVQYATKLANFYQKWVMNLEVESNSWHFKVQVQSQSFSKFESNRVNSLTIMCHIRVIWKLAADVCIFSKLEQKKKSSLRK